MEFIAVADCSALPEGRGLPVWVAGRNLALFKVGDAVHAVEDSCPHAGASLAGGQLEGCVVRCPAHGLPFDVRTGQMPGNPRLATACVPVRVDGGRVWVAVPGKDAAT